MMPNGGDGWFQNLTEEHLAAMNVGDTGTGVRDLHYRFNCDKLIKFSGLRESTSTREVCLF